MIETLKYDLKRCGGIFYCVNVVNENASLTKFPKHT